LYDEISIDYDSAYEYHDYAMFDSYVYDDMNFYYNNYNSDNDFYENSYYRYYMDTRDDYQRPEEPTWIESFFDWFN
jgi:hypothetical protein